MTAYLISLTFFSQNCQNKTQNCEKIVPIIHFILFCFSSAMKLLMAQTQSDIITSLFTWHSWLVTFHISQWDFCSAFKFLASACCSSCSMLQKPSTFPSSTCIVLLQGNLMYVIHGGYFICVTCSYMLLALLQQQSSRSFPPRPNTFTLPFSSANCYFY